MLQLEHIKKTYHVGEVETRALDDVSVSFRAKEFVAILGTSGSGKTTCLNIVGGLDRCDSGELKIKGKSTKDFKEKDWDAYRNNSVGFVFQSYNLIMHLSIVANVELGMTLSGVTAEEKHRRALEVLTQVGLKDHLHKKPNQLSGGQMQRVAIARALANNPEILLCDEPTGALDTATSVQIMDLIKEVAKDRLVIMVTHNPDLAEKYADRIIRFQDGKIISDSHPHEERPKPDSFQLKKTSMHFFTALRLSFNNIRTKKGRTFLTSFASSIGIIGIAVILSLSSGFQLQIDKFQRDALAEFPITISQTTMETDMETMMEHSKEMQSDEGKYPDTNAVTLYDPLDNKMLHRNELTQEYMAYLEAIDPEICSSIGYTRIVAMNMVRQTENGVVPVSISGQQTSGMAAMTSMKGVGLSSYPEQLQEGDTSYLTKNYDLLAGQYPASPTDLVLVVDEKNRVDFNIMKNLGFETENVQSIGFDQIVGTQMKIVTNDDYYVKSEMGVYLPGTDYQAMYDAPNSIPVRISGVVRVRQDVSIGLLGAGIAYSDKLAQQVIDSAQNSEIVKAQEESKRNVMTMEELTEEDRETFLAYLGGNATPYMVMIYPKDFEAKDSVIAYLEDYNDGKDTEDRVVYTDLDQIM